MTLKTEYKALPATFNGLIAVLTVHTRRGILPPPVTDRGLEHAYEVLCVTERDCTLAYDANGEHVSVFASDDAFTVDARIRRPAFAAAPKATPRKRRAKKGDAA